MIENLGVMQGRLLPKYQGRYQAHPVGYWQDEFQIAAELGLGLIEFIFDYDQAERNPLWLQSGLAEIRAVSERTGVRVKTICADYFMEAPLHGPNRDAAAQSGRMLRTLLKNARALGVTDIVIPCVDGAALRNERNILDFIANIRPAGELAERLGVNLALETDLPPRTFRELLDALDSAIFTVNYDTGNSAALGYDPVAELAAYGGRISDIHLKDRRRGGPSVELGTGDTDFQRFFGALSRIGYGGPLILQAYRDEEGLPIFKKQLEWLRPWLAGPGIESNT
jgi:L-ribulose-5-phosphate 3-epimerase